MPAFIPDDNIKKVPGVQPLQTKVELTKYRPLKFILGKSNRSNFNGKFSIPQFKIPIPGEGLPRIVHYLADQGGCAFWRLIWPGDELLSQNKAVVMSLYQMVQQAQFYLTVDAVRLQRQCTDHQREFVEFLRQVSDSIKQQTGKGFKILYEVDDICMPVDSIPDYNPCKQAFLDPKIGENMKKIVHLCVDKDTTIEVLFNGVPMTITVEEAKDHFDNGRTLQVLSKDLKDEAFSYKELENIWITNDEAEVVEIIDDENDKTIICTPDHPIYTKNRGWIEAGELIETDILDVIYGKQYKELQSSLVSVLPYGL